MSHTIQVTVPGSTPRTAVLSRFLVVTDPETGERDYAIPSEAAIEVLEAFRRADDYRGFTSGEGTEHDWEWISAMPTGHGDSTLQFHSWPPASDRRDDLPRSLWLLGDFHVAVEIVESDAEEVNPTV